MDKTIEGNTAVLYVVGKILKPFGLKGFVKVQPFTHSVQRFEQLNDVYVGADENNTTRCSVEHVKITQNGILVKFHKVDHKIDADKLAGQLLFVDEKSLFTPPKGSYFIHDIIGCTVWANDQPIGTIREVYSKAQGLAQDVWIIEGLRASGAKTKRYWLPAVSEFIQEVNLPRRKIIVKEIEELVEQ